MPCTLDELAKEPRCGACARPRSTCMCDRLPSPRLASPLEIVVLQHPQEDDVVLGTASLISRALEGAQVRVGLSWPSADAAIGRELARDRPLGQRGAVHFATKEEGATREGSAELAPGTVRVLDRHGVPVPAGSPRLEGLIVLDGTWSQAKTLWWRTAWLLKLGRLALVPREPSMYGKLRKEPRREWVSTLEAVADVLPALGPEAERERFEQSRHELRRLMRTMLQRVRDALQR
ncbi:MAG: DTW domain-containing protein [Deltaproteobacteria bacterium]